ncbi:MAG: ABC-F family ATP-binding cassette domain-containing protein [Sandaracinaceae bacterium]
MPTSAPPVLTAKGLAKAYGTHVLLDDVDVAVEARERVGMVGANGAGKSTLARILAGELEADAGRVVTPRDARVGYLPQVPRMDESATPREIVRQGLGPWLAAKEAHEAANAALGEAGADLDALLAAQADAAARIERLGGWDRDVVVEATLTHVGVREPDRPVHTMSGGERRRVALAKLLVEAPALAVLDEPTNHLDVETIEWLEAHLADVYPGAVLLVTHDRYVLDRVAERTLEVAGGKVFSYAGGYRAYLEAKAEREAHEDRVEANRQSFLRRELDWLRRSPSARRTKAKARVSQAEAALGAKGPTRRAPSDLRLETERLGKTVLDLSDLALEVGGRRVVDGLDLQLQRGERIGVVGPNGVGKTTLLRALVGDLAPVRGEVVVGKRTRFAYLDQRRSGLDDDRTLQENVAPDGKDEVVVAGRAVDVRTYLRRFRFGPERMKERVGALSGGERARVVLAKLLLQPANVLLLDEPTNDLDVATLGALEAMILDVDATAFVVSHDRSFLDRVATSILDFEGDGRVTRYVGNYDTFRRLKAQRAAAAPEPPRRAKAARAPGRAPAAPKPGLSGKERHELGRLEAAIAAAEARMAELDQALADPDLYASRRDEAERLGAERQALEADLEGRLERWAELEEKREQALE